LKRLPAYAMLSWNLNYNLVSDGIAHYVIMVIGISVVNTEKYRLLGDYHGF